MSTITLEINGEPVTASSDDTLLDIVHANKLDQIPTLCHSPKLAPYGSCFVCVVEVEGRPGLVPACSTKAAAGMKVKTRSERVVASRKTALELLMSNHYADCTSPCMEGCPAHVDAQGYIALTAMGLPREAVDLIRETNPLPAVCGRICVRRCEVVCRRKDVDERVAINAIKRHITDQPGIYDRDPIRKPLTGKQIALVGAGPASLTAAWFLGLQGHRPVLYEAQARAGGMLRYGIPEYRLPDEVLDREIDYIRRAGAEIKTGVRVGQDVTLAELKQNYDAVFLGVGAWAGKAMRVPGERETEGVITGADYLVQRTDSREPEHGTVAVVGGGNTAMDVARTAWRLGAAKVLIVYRRSRAEMPADPLEIEECLEEGIEIMEQVAPVKVNADAQGKLTSLRCVRMVLGEPDASGRRRPVPLEGSEFDLPCDRLVSAIGQDPVLEGLTEVDAAALGLTKWQTFKVKPGTFETQVPGIFAGGDAVDDGPTVVIDAIRDGQQAAAAIHAYLSGEAPAKKPFTVHKAFWAEPGKTELGHLVKSPRLHVHVRAPEARRSFEEVAVGFEAEDAAHECARCLSCGCVRYEDCDLRLYSEAYGVEMTQFSGQVRKHKVDERHPHIVYDPNKCILCARCIRTCERVLPISALGLVGRGFKTEMRPALNDPLAETNCVSCGNCVDACPTGALTVKLPFPGRASLSTTRTATHCGFCSLGCPVEVRTFGPGRSYATGRDDQDLCRYGRFGQALFLEPRLSQAVVRQGAMTVPVPMEAAVTRVAERLLATASVHGPASIGVFVSPDASVEEAHLAALLARDLGTPHVGSLSLLTSGYEAEALDAVQGVTASTADRQVLALADCVICTNTSLESEHLVLSTEVLAAKRRGAFLAVINATLGPADRHVADLGLDPMRGRAALLWRAVARALILRGRLSAEAISALPGGVAFLTSLPVEVALAAEAAGVTLEALEALADALARAERVVIVHTPDRTEDQADGDLPLLASLVGLLGEKAALLLPTKAPNALGLAYAGADPAFLPGRAPSGHATRATLEALTRGALKAAVIVGEDPLSQDRTASFFQGIEFLAALDLKATETTRFADVVLPASAWTEASGTRLSFDGRRLDFKAAATPASGHTTFEVLAALLKAIGHAVPAYAGLADSLLTPSAPALRALSAGHPGLKAHPLAPALTAIERHRRATQTARSNLLD